MKPRPKVTPAIILGLSIVLCITLAAPAFLKLGRYSTYAATTLVVKNLEDSGSGSLRQAVQDASDGDTIMFLPSLFGTITLTDGSIIIRKSITIKGPEGRIAISGNNDVCVFSIQSGYERQIHVELINLTIRDGDGFQGGGIKISGANVSIINSTIRNNRAGDGGGVYNPDGEVTIINSTISDNFADYSGGGILNLSEYVSTSVDSIAKLTIINSTIVNNSAELGGGIYSEDYDSPFTQTGPTVSNTIIAGNTSIAGNTRGADCDGKLTSGGYNLIQSPGCSIEGDTATNLTGVDPMLMQNNDGSADTYAPQEDSPVIDAIPPEKCTVDSDQRGFPRPIDADRDLVEECDIGAVEKCGSCLKLAEKFAPIIHMHEDDIYEPIGIELPLEHADLVKSSDVLKEKPLEHTDLIKNNTSDTRIRLFESDWWTWKWKWELNWSKAKRKYTKYISPAAQRVSYARVYCPPDSVRAERDIATVLQYWFFYYDNPWRGDIARHQGDWEMVQIMLDSDGNPTHAGYSQHYEGAKRSWQDMEVVYDQGGEHPVVYVAQDSHASFFTSSSWQYFSLDDTYPSRRLEDNPIPVKMLPETSDEDTWLYFKGLWGGDNNSPPGPRYRLAKHLEPNTRGGCYEIYEDPEGICMWDNPIEWFDALPSSDEAITRNHSGILWGVTDHPLSVEGELVVASSSTTVDDYQLAPRDIPGAEYFDNPETGKRTFVIHNPDPQATYKIHITTGSPVSGFPQQPSSQPVVVHFPDIQANKVLSATYELPDNWGETSKAVLLLHHASDFIMQVDTNADGTTDLELEPVEFQEEPFDLTPPGGIDDLHVVKVGEGNAKLTWTAPGDDGDSGTVDTYDIRYSEDPISTDNWRLALPITTTTVITPSVVGTLETATAIQLPQDAAYFAIKSIDDTANRSDLSNIAQLPKTPTPQERVYLPLVHR